MSVKVKIVKLNREDLVKQRNELLDALKPFADFSDKSDGLVPDDFVITQGSSIARRQITMGDCRAAKTAITKAYGL